MYVTDGAGRLSSVIFKDQLGRDDLIIMYLLSNDLLNIVCRYLNLIEAHYVNYF